MGPSYSCSRPQRLSQWACPSAQRGVGAQCLPRGLPKGAQITGQHWIQNPTWRYNITLPRAYQRVCSPFCQFDRDAMLDFL